MGVNLKTNCKDCIHEKVCKNHGIAESFSKRLSDLNYGCGPNDDYDWGTMSDHYHVKIDISCSDFEKRIPIKRTVDLRGYVSD